LLNRTNFSLNQALHKMCQSSS